MITPSIVRDIGTVRLTSGRHRFPGQPFRTQRAAQTGYTLASRAIIPDVAFLAFRLIKSVPPSAQRDAEEFGVGTDTTKGSGAIVRQRDEIFRRSRKLRRRDIQLFQLEPVGALYQHATVAGRVAHPSDPSISEFG
ncbi:hypothetical protein [Caballeronia sp. RCC_10]|uniref:hypothetical protein n=1 Tax=Caballeronia sp. RCC_10 TaxID=3239227 RepID=UPI0035235907